MYSQGLWDVFYRAILGHSFCSSSMRRGMMYVSSLSILVPSRCEPLSYSHCSFRTCARVDGAAAMNSNVLALNWESVDGLMVLAIFFLSWSLLDSPMRFGLVRLVAKESPDSPRMRAGRVVLSRRKRELLCAPLLWQSDIRLDGIEISSDLVSSSSAI